PPKAALPPIGGVVDDEDLPPLGAGAFLPARDRVELQVGRSTTVPHRLELPRRGTPLDLYVLVDTSISMKDDLPEVSRDLLRLIDRLLAQGVDVRVGLGEFKGQESTIAYRRVQGVGPEVEDFRSALAGLNALPADRLMRPAAPGSAGRNVARTLAQCAVVWGVTLVLLPALLLIVDRHFHLPRLASPGQLGIAAALFVAFSALNLWTGLTLATRGEGTPLPLEAPRHLVISGPYAWVRNPMAVAGLGQGMAVALAFGSWLLMAYVVAGGLLWNFGLRPPEERDLLARFGAEYEQYRRTIRCWIPALRPYRAASRTAAVACAMTLEESGISR
ncbi:MAG: hypothetical protein KY464_08355, partial [Gemmatimonadetes bacterium]|nr:hypothetical protein [Gemmatimonadota bacterium]